MSNLKNPSSLDRISVQFLGWTVQIIRTHFLFPFLQGCGLHSLYLIKSMDCRTYLISIFFISLDFKNLIEDNFVLCFWAHWLILCLCEATLINHMIYTPARVTFVWSLWRYHNLLWRHQQDVNRARETRGRCMKIVVFIVIYGFVMSCKK